MTSHLKTNSPLAPFSRDLVQSYDQGKQERCSDDEPLEDEFTIGEQQQTEDCSNGGRNVLLLSMELSVDCFLDGFHNACDRLFWSWCGCLPIQQVSSWLKFSLKVLSQRGCTS